MCDLSLRLPIIGGGVGISLALLGKDRWNTVDIDEDGEVTGLVSGRLIEGVVIDGLEHVGSWIGSCSGADGFIVIVGGIACVDGLGALDIVDLDVAVDVDEILSAVLGVV